MREILVPLALAIMLSFVLTPPLLMLRRIKAPRVLAVSIVVGAAFLVIFVIGWLLSGQVTQLAGELPKYQTVLTKKIGDLSNAVSGAPLFRKAATALKQIEQGLSNPRLRRRSEPSPGRRSRSSRASSRSPSKSAIPRPRRSRSIKASPEHCCRRSPPPASCFCSWCLSCSSAKICATG
jgi:hypothetical protein